MDLIEHGSGLLRQKVELLSEIEREACTCFNERGVQLRELSVNGTRLLSTQVKNLNMLE